MKNVYEYTSEKFNTTYLIEVLHKRDGSFLAVPVDASGRRARSKNCRRANLLPRVVKTIITDVLETKPPAEVFAQ
jgi:hypothetical protein